MMLTPTFYVIPKNKNKKFCSLVNSDIIQFSSWIGISIQISLSTCYT